MKLNEAWQQAYDKSKTLLEKEAKIANTVNDLISDIKEYTLLAVNAKTFAEDFYDIETAIQQFKHAQKMADGFIKQTYFYIGKQAMGDD